MNVKQTPDDFRVEELTDVRPEAAGPFALYRLVKTGWTTPDALAAVRRRWHIDLDRLSYGGLKDRHAHTIQFFTIRQGPVRKLTLDGISVEYVGQTHEPYTSHHIRANRFRLGLRKLDAADVTRAETVVSNLIEIGVPNYFDDQRFGSVRAGEPFIARALIADEFETALRIALTSTYEFDRGVQKKEKALLRGHWGDWKHLAQHLPRGHARSLVTYLVHHPDDFRGAVVRLRPELRGLYLSAYQSHLWNRILARWLESFLPVQSLRSVSLCMGPVPMPLGLNPEELQRLTQTMIPLPSARTKLADDEPFRPIFDAVLDEDGLTLADMQIKGVREMFFSKGERVAQIVPNQLRWAFEADELHRERKKMLLSFELPRGSYATLLVKRIQAEAS